MHPAHAFYPGSVSRVLSVNIARPRPNPAKTTTLTGIDKVPTDDAVTVRASGSTRSGLGGGLTDDVIGNKKLHGGDGQAVYAYAREDLLLEVASPRTPCRTFAAFLDHPGARPAPAVTRH